MLDLPDEASSQEPSEFLTNRLALLFVEAVEALLHWLGINVDVKSMLGDPTEDVGHVRGLPCKDICVVMQELYEGRFHVWGHASAYVESLLWILRMDLDHLCVVHWAKGHH